MGKSVRQPRKHIVSCRISLEEKSYLTTIAKQHGTNISELLRQSLELIGRQRNSCPAVRN